MQNSIPPHPGHYIRSSILPPGLSVKDAAKQLAVGRPALSNLLNARASLSSDMAMRIEKAFGADGAELLKMQAAYDQAQVQAREPGIAVRAYTPNLFSIKAMQVEAWSERMEARSELAVLLRRLVVSTGLSLAAVDFPGHENAQRHGWDGFITAESATPWIPLGDSGWEFGVNQNPAQKAEKDYNERTGELSPEVRAKTTFVFVTPRNWSGKTAWVAAKMGQKMWKAVRAYDASNLEQWLETSIPAQAWFADRLGVGGHDVLDLEGCWRRWADVTEPVLSKVLFKALAEPAAKQLSQWLARPANMPFTIVADSNDEALAALACAFEAAPLAQEHARERVVVIRSVEALAKIAPASASFIAVLASPDVETEAAGLHRRQHTIVITRRNAVEGQPDLSVDLVDGGTFRAGLEDMGYGFQDFEHLARESGYSLTVLRRRLAVSPSLRSPPWAGKKELASKLIPLAFVGAWEASSEADREVMVGIAAMAYNDIEKIVAELVGEPDSPVWSIGNMRGVVSKTDTFYAVQRFVTAAELHRFFDVARIVLAEEDPALELPENERWMAGLYGKTRKHSGALRQGICETLVLLSVHGDNLFKSRLGFNVSAEVGALVRELLTPLDGATWQSHRNDLPRYAEAAPDIFLGVLEADLLSDSPKVYELMSPTSSALFSSPGRTGLLWALETLAWNPLRLDRVVKILGKLAELKIDDNWVNKPENSLAAIFRCWMPQTAAPIDNRIEVLKRLAVRSPRVGWRMCLNQFDVHSSVGHYSAKPHWRSDAAGAGEPVSNYERWQMARAALDLAISWPEHDESTLGDLVERLEGIPDDQDAVWGAVAAWISTGPTDSAKAKLRERIRRSVMILRRRRGDHSPTSSRVLEIYAALQPADLIWRHQWLFEKQWVEETPDEISNEQLDFQEREARINERRNEALREIWNVCHFEGIGRLCELSEAPRMIGWFLAQILDADEALHIAAEIVEGDLHSKLDECVSGLLSNLPPASRDYVMNSAKFALDGVGLFSVMGFDRLLRYAPFTLETWDFIETLPSARRKIYWQGVPPGWLVRNQPEETNRAVDGLLEAHRPRAAFTCVHMALSTITSSKLLLLLHEAATCDAEPAGHYTLSPYDISRAFEILASRNDVEPDSLATLEFLYIEVLQDQKHGIPNLERQLSVSPTLFIQALAFAFKRSDGGEDPPESRPKNASSAAGLARASYALLSRAQRLPGTNDKGEVDIRKLYDWIAEVRILARKYGRESVADSLIGQLFAKSAPGGDGIWPNEVVREVLEDIGTPEIANGMQTARFNARGPTWRGKGGDQERQLVDTYNEWSTRVATRYPFTARMLANLAATYSEQAEWHDNRSLVSKRLPY